MRTSSKTALATFAVGAVALLPGGVAAHANDKDPGVRAAGDSGPPPVLPSAVRVRIQRGEAALNRAADYVDRDKPEKAIASLKNARRNMYAAWRSAMYIVENAPPAAPPADDKAQVVASGAPVGGPGNTYETPENTAFAVLEYQHDVVVEGLGVIDGAKGTLRDEVSKTLFAALDRRDSAITYIHNRPEPPAPPADKTGTARRDDPAPTGFAAVMPALVPDLDDELQQTRELSKGGALTPGEKRVVLLARDQIGETQDTVNAWWPPLPAGD